MSDAAHRHAARELAERIEPCAMAAWPALERVRLSGWTLRFATGFTRRANSVATFGFEGDDPGPAIDAAEQEYVRRRLAPMFQLTPATDPPGLDAALAARGYRAHANATVHIVVPERARNRLPDPGGVRLCSRSDEAFAALVVRGSHSREDGQERLAVLSRVRTPLVCAAAYDGRDVVAVGTGALSEGLVGINLVRTDADHRRRGHARRLLSAIADWAIGQRARLLYLSVERDNAPAIALYAGCGFEPAYEYFFLSPGR